MRRSLVITLCVPLALLLTDAARADEAASAKTAAQEAAKTWLAVVDAGEYLESWEQASSLFRRAVTKDAWVGAVKAARGPLGAVKERKLRSADYTTSLPGAPDGQYVVLQYETSFEHKAAAVETVTPMLDADGKWRMAGYFVR